MGIRMGSSAPRLLGAALAMAMATGCGGAQSEGGAAVTQVEDPPTAAIERRPFAPMVNGQPVTNGISYGPYREGQRPGGPNPSEEEIREDLNIIAERWQMIRIYGSTAPGETILRLIRDENIPLKVMVGAWLEPEVRDGVTNEDHVAQNAEQVREAIRLANAFPEVVAAVNVGNETQVFWAYHRSTPEELLGHLRTVRTAIQQPVTTADDYNFWNKPESHRVAAEVDFLLLHCYAMWNRQSLDDAVAWTARTVESIQAEHPDLTVVIGETGWATVVNPDATGDEASQIVGVAGEEEQRVFYEGFTAWAQGAGVPYFYFEAFDEPWKGGPDPRGAEKHWGLYTVDRQPKLAIREPTVGP